MAEYITITGLAFDIVGVLLLFLHSPEKYPDPQWSAFFKVEGEAARRREEWLKKRPARHRIAKLAVVLVIVGFTLQLVGEVVALFS